MWTTEKPKRLWIYRDSAGNTGWTSEERADLRGFSLYVSADALRALLKDLRWEQDGASGISSERAHGIALARIKLERLVNSDDD